MKDGFIKVAAITPSVSVGDTEYNTTQIIYGMQTAHKDRKSVV